MPSRPSFVGRATLAVAFFIGFYVLALAVAALLVYIPYAEFHYLNRIDPRIAIWCAVGALAILSGIMPRRDKFEAPGPLLSRDGEPKLYAELDRIAAEMGQAVPKEVYLIPETNAWVAQRGGVLGIGSRRVMGIGYPLLQSLSVAEMRAVLAHEFGHYHGGDTATGPWLYTTRSAIARVLQSLGGRAAIAKLFEWYGLTFLRITQAISRQQELVADEMAARIAGARSLADGLAKIAGEANAFAPFFNQEVVPALLIGRRPSLAEGFRRFLAAPAVASGTAALAKQELARTEPHRYDSHPPMRERIAALERMPNERVSAAARSPALTLLADADATEQRLIEFLIPAEHRRPLTPVRWDDMSAEVWIPRCRESVTTHALALRGLTPESFPDIAAQPRPFAGKMKILTGVSVREQHWTQINQLLGSALVLALEPRGWTLHGEPGYPLTLSRADERFSPYEVIPALSAGRLAPDAWRAQCATLEIAGLDLGSLVSAAVSAPDAALSKDPGFARRGVPSA